MLDALERSFRNLRGADEAAAPALVGGMKADQDRLEAEILRRMRELLAGVEAAQAELRRCDHNLDVLRRRAEKISPDKAKEELERAKAAQEMQRQHAERQRSELLEMICRIAVGLQRSHGLPAALLAPPVSFPSGHGRPHLPGPPVPGAGRGIDDLISMGPTHER